MQWFNGTHVVRVTSDDTKALGVNIECAEADVGGRIQSPFSPFVADQKTFYRDMAVILAEGYRHM